MDYPTKIKIGTLSYLVSYENSSVLTSNVRVKNGKVVVKLSRFLRGHNRDETVNKFLIWAEKRLSKASSNDFVLPDYKDGGAVCTHNRSYSIKVTFVDRINASVRIENGLILVVLPNNCSWNKTFVNNKVKFLVEKIIMEDQIPYLGDVLSELNQLHFKERINSFKFKRTKSRFGSCSPKRNINISYRLLFAPREVFRYVCVHELAHLNQMNHSRKFWALVKEALPNYKEYERWLRNSGFMLG